MTRPVLTVRADTPIDEVVATMQRHQIRRVPIIDGGGCCAGIIAQADLASEGPAQKTAERVRKVSQSTGQPWIIIDGDRAVMLLNDFRIPL
ncbi:MAG: CBS domain-containing protein [Vicinamibacterales bacterium]